MFKVFDLKTFVDERGQLTPIELKDFIKFETKRIYTVHHNLMKRGGHAHLEEEEFFFMSSGSCDARLHDGKSEHIVKLHENSNAFYVGTLVWHEFDNFSDNAVLVALSSTNYNPNRSGYIEDFNKFVEYVR